MLLATAYVCLLLFSYLYYITHIIYLLFFFNDTTTTNIYTLSLHDALPISQSPPAQNKLSVHWEELSAAEFRDGRSEEHTSELQSPDHLVCRLLLEKKKKKTTELADFKKLSIMMQRRKPQLPTVNDQPAKEH